MDAIGQHMAEYSEAECFELYCANGGKIGAMERHISSLPAEKRIGYPSRATLYRYEADYQWDERYAKIRESVKEELEGEVGMTYDRINRLSALAIAGLSKRLHQAYEAGNLDAFTPRLLEIMWKMQRVERGLANHVPYEQQREELPFRATGVSPERMKQMQENMDKLSPEELRILSVVLAVPKPPAILEKKS